MTRAAAKKTAKVLKFEKSSAPKHPNRLLSVRECADRLGCSCKSVRLLISERTLPALRLRPGGVFRVRPGDLDALIERLMIPIGGRR
jgi:excisionase family DNA binding protein